MIREAIIVYEKSEKEIADKLYDLVMLIDDKGPDRIVGTRDNSVHLARIEKKSWEEMNTLSNPVTDKVILINPNENIEEVKFSKYEVSYGLSDNKLIIRTEVDKLIDNPKQMKAFLAKYNEDGETVSNVLTTPEKKKKAGKVFRKIGTTLLIGPGVIFTEKKLDELEGKTQHDILKHYMLMYAVKHIYYNYLEEYLSME